MYTVYVPTKIEMLQKKISKEDLIECLEDGMTAVQIANKYGITINDVGYIKNKYKVRNRDVHSKKKQQTLDMYNTIDEDIVSILSGEEKDKVLEMRRRMRVLPKKVLIEEFKNNLSYLEIANKYGLRLRDVTSLVNKYNIRKKDYVNIDCNKMHEKNLDLAERIKSKQEEISEQEEVLVQEENEVFTIDEPIVFKTENNTDNKNDKQVNNYQYALDSINDKILGILDRPMNVTINNLTIILQNSDVPAINEQVFN